MKRAYIFYEVSNTAILNYTIELLTNSKAEVSGDIGQILHKKGWRQTHKTWLQNIGIRIRCSVGRAIF